MRKKLIIIITFIFLLILLLPAAAVNLKDIAKKDYLILNRFPHDPDAFTQGLEIYQQKLYQSTGLYGKSSLRSINLKIFRLSKKSI